MIIIITQKVLKVKMSKNGMNISLCRLCGFKNEDGQCLNDEDNAELLAKIQMTISPLVCKDDPLPKKVCIQCQQDVYIFHNKIKRFRTLESKWCDILKEEKPNHPYLELINLYDNNKTKFQEKIDACDEKMGLEAEKDQDPLAEIPDTKVQDLMTNKEHTKTSTELNDTEEIAKSLERERNRVKKRRQHQFSGYVRSRALRNKNKKQIKVKNESIVSPRSELKSESSPMPDECDELPRPLDYPYKKYRNPILEIISKNEILDSRTRTNRRTSKPFVYDFHTVKAQGSSTKKIQPSTETSNTISSKSVNGKSKSSILLNESSVAESPSRKRRRINYSEELVDEAFMYEQMLENKQHEEKRHSPKKPGPASSKKTNIPNASAGNIDSRLRLLEQRNEISIMPVKSRLVSKMDVANPNGSVSSKPQPLFNITSAVSVHIKPRNSTKASTSEPTVPILHIRRGQNGYEATASKKGRVICKKCNQKCANLKALAVHQLVHLSIATHRIDSGKVLHPRLRRGRMLKIDQDNFIRCVNCAKLHPNNKSILDHWNNGECVFYCWLCGKSFHDEKINDLDSHFQTEHGIKRLDPSEVKRIEAKVNKTKEQPNFDNACKLCKRTFCSRQALSTHLTMSHERKLSQTKEISAINRERKKIGSRKTVNPVALATKIADAMGQNPGTSVKNVKKSINKPLYNKPVASNVPKKVTQQAQPPMKKKKPKKSKPIHALGKLPAQVISNLNVTIKRVRTQPETPPKSNPDVSSTTDHPYATQFIKSEPIDDYVAINDTEMDFSMPDTYENWDQRVDSSIDTSPRLKVKNLTDLQAPSQLFSLDTHSFVQTQPQKDQVIMSNGNVSGLQIQNVQSYHTHTMSLQQPYSNANYTCINGNLNLSDGIQSSSSMCPPNLYEMQPMSHAPPSQNNQLINPVYLLQQSSSHGPY